MLLGNALAGLQSLDDAVAVAERAAQLEPERAGLQSNIGVLQLARGNVEHAETAFKKAVATEPNAVKPLLAIANFYQNVGRFSDAEAALRRALALEPKNPRANQTLGKLLIASDRPLEAEPFVIVATQEIGTVEAKLSLADYYLAIGKVKESLHLLEQVSASPEGYASGRIRTAMISYASGKTDEAHRILNEVLTKDPKNATALAVEGRFLLAEHKPHEALTLANAALAADPRSAQAYVTLGHVHLARNAPDEARKAFAEALNNDPSRVDAQVELARIHLVRKEVDTSIEYAERGIKTDPNSLEAHLALVRGLSVRPDDLPKADAALRELMAKHSWPQPRTSAAGASRRATGFGGARKSFGRALELNPDNIEALGGLTALDFSARKGCRGVRAWRHAWPRPPAIQRADSVAAKSTRRVQGCGETETMLRKLADMDPSNLEPTTFSASSTVTTRKLDAAKAEFTLIAAREPSRDRPYHARLPGPGHG